MSSNNEEWRPLVALGIEVSDHGRLRALVKGKLRVLKARDNGRGYWNVNRNNRTVYVHRLVAEAFLGGPHPDLEVNHKDGNKSNNHCSNLEWVTQESNRAHAMRLGLIPRFFDNEQTQVIWFMHDCGMAVTEIAKQMKTKRGNIYTALERRKVV